MTTITPPKSVTVSPEPSASIYDLIKKDIRADYFQQNFPNDGQRFVAWYLRRVMLRDRITARDDITDGPNDKQMDAVIVDDDERRIVIVQGKFIGERSVDAEPLREVLGAWALLQDLESLQRDCNDKLKQKLEAVRRGLEDEYRVDFELLTTGTLTPAAQADMKAFSDRLEDSDDFAASLHLIDTEVLQTRLAEAEAMELPSLDHAIVVDTTTTLVTKVGERQIVVTMLPLHECLRLPGITDGRLFRKNVRRGGWGRAGNSERAPSAPAADLGASPFRRRPQPPLSCDLRLDHARFPCRRCQKAGPVRSGRSLLAHDIIECLRGGDDRSAMGLAAAATWPALILQHSTFVVACICPRWRESDELMAAIDPGMPGIGIDPGGVRRPGGDHAYVPAGDCPPADGPGQ